MLQNKKILITGGTGSFGKAFVKSLLKKYPKIKKLIIYSRDELKQHDMALEYNEKKYPGIRYFLGDIRDYPRLNLALKDVDIVIHAAALKHVTAAEYNPFEFIKTNVLGSQNIVDACLNNNVSNVIALSTDKAVSPTNLYGASKLCSDKIFLSANNIKGSQNLKFSVVRYGNVFGSRGSVVPIFLEQKKKKTFNITDKRMTRFNITLKDSVDMVLWALKNNFGSEIFIPKLKSYNILDLAKSIDEKCKIKFIGIKTGEKLHEQLLIQNDTSFLIDYDKYYIQTENIQIARKLLKKLKKAKLLKDSFTYSSDTNEYFLTSKELKKLVQDFTKSSINN